MLDIIEEDVFAALDCVDFLGSKLNVLQPEGKAGLLWGVTKDAVRTYIVSRGGEMEFSIVKEFFQELGSDIGMELSLHVSVPLACLYVHVHAAGLLTSQALAGELVEGYIRRYLVSLNGLPNRIFSEHYMVSLRKLESLLQKSLEIQLDLAEIQTVAEITVWQTRNFLYHVQPSSIGHDDVGDHSTGMRVVAGRPEDRCSHMEPNAEAAGSGSGRDEDEKADKSEKKDKPDCDEINKPSGVHDSPLMGPLVASVSKSDVEDRGMSESVCHTHDALHPVVHEVSGTERGLSSPTSLDSVTREAESMGSDNSYLTAECMKRICCIEREIEDLSTALCASSQSVVTKYLQTALNEKKDELLAQKSLLVSLQHNEQHLLHRQRFSLRQLLTHHLKVALCDIVRSARGNPRLLSRVFEDMRSLGVV